MALGTQWADSIVVFLALGPAALLATFNVAGSWSATPCGFTGRLLKWSLIGPPLTIAAYVIGGWLGGIVGVAIGFSVAQVVLRPFALTYILRPTPVSFLDVMAASGPPMLATSAAAAVGLMVTTSFELVTVSDRLIAFVAGGTAFTAVFLTILSVLPSAKPQRELVRQLAQPLLDRIQLARTTKENRG